MLSGNSRGSTFDVSEAELRRKRIISWAVTSVVVFLVGLFFLKMGAVFLDSYHDGTLRYNDIQKTRELCSQVGEKSMRMHEFCNKQEVDVGQTPGVTAVSKTYDRVYYGAMGAVYMIVKSSYTLLFVALASVILGAYANHRGWFRFYHNQGIVCEKAPQQWMGNSVCLLPPSETCIPMDNKKQL
jgi:hypothetical protein